jgi:ADP-heptose:LPS heptosyltransferase
MSLSTIAFASAKSFGDFVIAHSVLGRIETCAKYRVRLIACSHLKALNAILPNDVRVTLMDSGEERVPAIFDVKKYGAWAALQSAVSLRRRFQDIERHGDEVLAFDALGIRERFIAGRWPVASPRARSANIYETYSRFLSDQDIPTAPPPPANAPAARSVGIFPESRLIEKRLGAPTVAAILNLTTRVGLAAKIFMLDGDVSALRGHPKAVTISRDFESLADAIRSVDSVISADSLPAHLAEYFGRPVFVASSAPNEYWLPQGCFRQKRWGVFGDEAQFSASLDKFLAEVRAS